MGSEALERARLYILEDFRAFLAPVKIKVKTSMKLVCYIHNAYMYNVLQNTH